MKPSYEELIEALQAAQPVVAIAEDTDEQQRAHRLIAALLVRHHKAKTPQWHMVLHTEKLGELDALVIDCDHYGLAESLEHLRIARSNGSSVFVVWSPHGLRSKAVETFNELASAGAYVIQRSTPNQPMMAAWEDFKAHLQPQPELAPPVEIDPVST